MRPYIISKSGNNLGKIKQSISNPKRTIQICHRNVMKDMKTPMIQDCSSPK